jgi:hypothetical protein
MTNMQLYIDFLAEEYAGQSSPIGKINHCIISGETTDYTNYLTQELIAIIG